MGEKMRKRFGLIWGICLAITLVGCSGKVEPTKGDGGSDEVLQEVWDDQADTSIQEADKIEEDQDSGEETAKDEEQKEEDQNDKEDDSKSSGGLKLKIKDRSKEREKKDMISLENLSEEDQKLTRSIVSTGNNYRLYQVIEKIKSGEAVTIGYIGGSITEGYFASTEDIFAKLVTEYLGDTYGKGDNVTYVNAGLSGTPSMLGLIRSERDLLEKQPDLVFVEFAVNDGQSLTDQRAYESLVRKALTSEQAPAVCLLFSVVESGYTCQEHMSKIGEHYQLPMVSVKNVLQPEFDAGTMEWKDWSNDGSHPNRRGHEMYAKMIILTLETALIQEKDEDFKVADMMLHKDWSSMKLFDNQNITPLSYGSFENTSAHFAFPNSISHLETNIENEPLVFEFSGNTLFLTYKTVNTGNYGAAEVYVDGVLTHTLNGLTADGWNNPTTALIFADEESKKHKVEIKMVAGDEGKIFDLLAMGIVE